MPDGSPPIVPSGFRSPRSPARKVGRSPFEVWSPSAFADGPFHLTARHLSEGPRATGSAYTRPRRSRPRCCPGRSGVVRFRFLVRPTRCHSRMNPAATPRSLEKQGRFLYLEEREYCCNRQEYGHDHAQCPERVSNPAWRTALRQQFERTETGDGAETCENDEIGRELLSASRKEKCAICGQAHQYGKAERPDECFAPRVREEVRFPGTKDNEQHDCADGDADNPQDETSAPHVCQKARQSP